MVVRVAIIGAGIAGLTLARELHDHADVTVFEKSRGVGGRMATRRAEPFHFDHGTQYFTGRSRPFREFLAPWIKRGVVASWEGNVVTLAPAAEPAERFWFEPHYVGLPGMNGLCKALAEGMNVRTEVQVAPLSARAANGWALQDIAGNALGLFDWVITTAPAPQSAALIGTYLPDGHPLLSTALQGCYALMLGFDHPWAASWIGAKCDESALGWISVNSSKPGRDASHTAVVAHSTNEWAAAHLEDDSEAVQTALLDAFSSITGMDATRATHIALHRWRYALVSNPSKSGFYCDTGLTLAAVGDWSVTSRIEEVWFASHELAQAIRAEL